MPGVSRKNTDSAGGTLGTLASTVKVNNQTVVVKGSPVAGHGDAPHAAPTMAESSSTVKADGIYICRAGDAATCGHTASGSGNVSAG